MCAKTDACLMIWLQIKQTDAVFSRDLQTIGKFDNCSGTGQCLRFFSCVVRYSTGVNRRLLMMTSTDARPGTVRCRYKRSYGARPILHGLNKFSSAMMYIIISTFAIIPQKKHVVKKDWGQIWQINAISK